MEEATYEVLGEIENNRGMETLVKHFLDLIHGLPYYRNSEFLASHRHSMANAFAVNLPNPSIAPQKQVSVFCCVKQDLYKWFTYFGPYDGYRSVFYHSLAMTDLASKMVDGLLENEPGNGSVIQKLLKDYSVALLSDRLKAHHGQYIDEQRLANRLGELNQELGPRLSPTYQTILEWGFDPTSASFALIRTSSEETMITTLLDEVLASGHFTPNINRAIDMGGDSALAAEWFLFNLWMIFKTLGFSDIDAAIARYESDGLHVPPQIGPERWWNGGYVSWHAPMTGDDAIPHGSEASRELQQFTQLYQCTFPYAHYFGCTLLPAFEPLSGGYFRSFLQLGPLAYFKA